MNELKNELNELNELKSLWSRFFDVVLPDEQFKLWLTLHTYGTARHGILKAAQKNLAMNLTMTGEHLVRFASKVMNTSTSQKQAGQAGGQQ
jgi:hypothetical protein